jgi:hypothetical protein
MICAGGPWRGEIVRFDVENLAERYPQAHDNTMN